MTAPTSLRTLDGELRRDDATRDGAAHDFGGLVSRVPAAVLEPGSADDIAAAIRWAAHHGLQLAAQGRRHSTFGRSAVQGGIVADMSPLRSIGAVEGDRVRAGAGATWREVLRATLARGKTPPVLTDYLDLSVGGTLTVGGIGAATPRFGAQSDNVLELDVVTGTGQRVVCSADERPDLFDAVRAGLGQVAIITAATLALVPAPVAVRRFLLSYSTVAALLEDQRHLAASGRFDAVQGAIAPAPGGGLALRLDLAKAFTEGPPDDDVLLTGLSDDRGSRDAATLSYFDYLDRLAPLEAQLRVDGQWRFPHPWLMTFVGDTQVEAVVEGELRALDPVADLGPLGQIVLSPIRRSAVRSPLLRMPADDLCFALNFLRLPAFSDGAEAWRLVAANEAAHARISAAAGTLYPVSALPLSARQWRSHFGSGFGLLEAAKARYDPNTVLTPGYDLFPRDGPGVSVP